ncbi:MAG: MarR family transcriptional regulator [Pirellulales bacterium]|nr:MarR family transcriptional regulator [Pirellulales bacterium]
MSDILGLEDQVIGALRRITRAIDLHSRLLLKTCGLTVPQLAALRAIERCQPTTVGALAREIHLGQATVTGILSRLEGRGLVVRTRGSRDRRSVHVELTEAGAALLHETHSPLHERFHRELARIEEWERTMILATLQRIAAMMDAEAIESATALMPDLDPENQDNLADYLEKAVLPGEEGPLA